MSPPSPTDLSSRSETANEANASPVASVAPVAACVQEATPGITQSPSYVDLKQQTADTPPKEILFRMASLSMRDRRRNALTLGSRAHSSDTDSSDLILARKNTIVSIDTEVERWPARNQRYCYC